MLDEAQRLQLVDDHVKTFADLMAVCPASYPDIVVPSAGDPPLTTAQLQTNYEQIALCGYKSYGAKPYWVPQLLLDVDVCARALGPSWRLPTEADINAFTDADFQFFADSMTVPGSIENFPSEWYYRLDVYARASDGSLVLGKLAPGATHLLPLPISSASMNTLYLGDGSPIGVRCLRTTAAP